MLETPNEAPQYTLSAKQLEDYKNFFQELTKACASMQTVCQIYEADHDIPQEIRTNIIAAEKNITAEYSYYYGLRLPTSFATEEEKDEFIEMLRRSMIVSMRKVSTYVQGPLFQAIHEEDKTLKEPQKTKIHDIHKTLNTPSWTFLYSFPGGNRDNWQERESSPFPSLAEEAKRISYAITTELMTPLQKIQEQYPDLPEEIQKIITKAIETTDQAFFYFEHLALETPVFESPLEEKNFILQQLKTEVDRFREEIQSIKKWLLETIAWALDNLPSLQEKKLFKNKKRAAIKALYSQADKSINILFSSLYIRQI